MRKRMVFIILFLIIICAIISCSKTNNSNKIEIKEKISINNNNEIIGKEYKEKDMLVLRDVAEKTVNLNPHNYTLESEGKVISLIYANLLAPVWDYKTNEYSIIGDQAIEYPSKDIDRKVWTFKIKDGLSWDNGEVIDAKSYELSYKMLLDPRLKNIRANIFTGGEIEVVNARKYWLGKPEDNIKLIKFNEITKEIEELNNEIDNEGYSDKLSREIEEKIKQRARYNSYLTDQDLDDMLKQGGCDWESVGIKAIDNNTLEIHLVNPVSDAEFYAAFMGGKASSPINKIIYESGFNYDKSETDYGTSINNTPSCGIYLLKEWALNQKKTYIKNTNSQLSKYYNIDKYESRVIENELTKLQLYEGGEIDYINLSNHNYNKYKNNPRLFHARTTAMWHLFVNSNHNSGEKEFLNDINFRKALSHATDRNAIINRIMKKDLASNYIIPSSKIIGVSKWEKYRENIHAKSAIDSNSFDTEIAKDFFDKAYKNYGDKKLELELLYFNDSEDLEALAKFIKNAYEGLFGESRIEIKLVSVPWDEGYERMRAGKYDMCFGAYSGYLFNLWKSMLPFTSSYNNKIDSFNDYEFDQLYNKTTKSDLLLSKNSRLQLLSEMENDLLDQAIVIPIFEERRAYLVSDRIELTAKDNWIEELGNIILQSKIINNK